MTKNSTSKTTLKSAASFSKQARKTINSFCWELAFSIALIKGRVTPKEAKLHYGDKLFHYVNVRAIVGSVKLYIMIHGKRVKPKRHFVLGGPWDIDAPYFSEDETCIDVVYMHVSNKHYKDSILYKRYLSRLQCNNPEIHHGKYLDTEEILDEYFQGFYSLYNSIKNDGYVSQRKMGGDEDTEIGIAIGRTGEPFHFRTGHHRLAMAKILDVESIPVVVHFVHREWVKKCIRKYKTLPSIAVSKGLEEMQKKVTDC